MFNRSRSSSEGEPPHGAAETAETSGSEAARAFDQVLSELQPPGAKPSDPDAASVTATTTEHAATLRATRDAHQEAQGLLAMATEARKTASEEAERIVLEARDAADRSRQELSGWAAAQRAKVDALAADLVASANKDADAIRAEALRTSMAEAEETASAYIAEATEKAKRDADAIRADARGVLARAVELGGEVTGAIEDLTTRMSDIMSRLEDARGSMEQVLADNRPPEGEAVDESEDDEADDSDESEDDQAEKTDEDDEAQETDDAQETGDDGEGDADAADDGSHDGDDQDEDDDTGSDEPADRQLGSMFRRHGQRRD